MKKVSVLVSFLFFVLSASAYAADALSVKITSFRSIETGGVLAEACGVVTLNQVAPGSAAFVAVTVTSDPGHNPGQYTMLADPTGAFCTVLVTSYGQVEASAWIQGTPTAAKSAVFTLKK
jgi:hypothetical protein